MQISRLRLIILVWRLADYLCRHVLAEIDKLTDNPSAAFEEALRLWRAKKIEEQLKQFYQNRSQADIKEEQEWAEIAEDEEISGWDEFAWDAPNSKEWAIQSTSHVSMKSTSVEPFDNQVTLKNVRLLSFL